MTPILILSLKIHVDSLRGRPKDSHSLFSRGACTQGWCKDGLKERAREKRESQVGEKRKPSPGGSVLQGKHAYRFWSTPRQSHTRLQLPVFKLIAPFSNR